MDVRKGPLPGIALARRRASDVPRLWEEDLDPELFLRVHRSVILRRDTVTGLYRDEAGHWTARLRDGGEQRIGRSYVDNVKRFAGRG